MVSGLRRYFTGSACVYGHVTERLVSNYRCLECNRAAYRKCFPAGSLLRAERSREYYERNRERENVRSQKWRNANADRATARVRGWLAANPEKRCVNRRNYEARKRDAVGTHTLADVMALLTAQSSRCGVCHTDLGDGYHVDHKHPLARGGSNGPDNLQLLCPTCNRSKGAKTMEEWLSSRQVA